jgi:hypothetical protein
MNRAFLGLALVAACGSSDNSGFDGGSDATAGDGDANPFQQPDTGPTTYSDFPTNPVVDPSLPSNIATLFGDPDAGTAAAPCIAEPAADAMIPKNWTPLFLEYAAGGANVYEIRVTVDNQKNPGIYYVPTATYTLDQNLWKSLAAHSAGHDMNVSVRGGTLANQQVTNVTAESTSTVHIAPVDAPGSVVYWSSTGGTAFKGFTVGDLTSKTVLTPATAGASSANDGTTTCVSCHTSSPDGTYVIYTRDTASSRAIDARTVVGAAAPNSADFSPSALALLGRDHQGAPLLNVNHYSASDAIAISVLYNPTATGSPNYELVWTNLHAPDMSGFGVLARTGEPRPGIASPTWRHDGTAIAYVSSDSAGEAVVSNGNMDIYKVPYNNHAGGAATPFQGASDPNYHEFYPVYSPNDTLLAFNRTDNTPPNSYNQPAAELFIVAGGGGSALRLRANDPPTCTTLKSPGLTNAWPRWAPQSQANGSLNYYWIVFSSKRRPATGLNPQLYVAAVVTKVVNNVESIYADYPAVYVLSQDPTQNNHTPAWDNFNVQGIPN